MLLTGGMHPMATDNGSKGYLSKIIKDISWYARFVSRHGKYNNDRVDPQRSSCLLRQHEKCIVITV